MRSTSRRTVGGRPLVPARRGREELRVPAGVQDHDAALRGHHAPVAPQRRPLALDLVGLPEAVHRDELRIEPAEQLVHDLAAPGARDAGDDHRDGARLRLAQLELRVEQPILQLRQLVPVLELGQSPTAQGLVQHGGRRTQRLRAAAAAATTVAARRDLLRDAVDVAAPEQDLAARHAHDLATGEQRREAAERGAVAPRIEQRHHDALRAEVEVDVGSGEPRARLAGLRALGGVHAGGLLGGEVQRARLRRACAP